MISPNIPSFLRARPLLALFALVLLAGVGASVSAGPGEAPEQSVFLVATERLEGTSFQRTVILMTHMGGQAGTTGLAINRTTDVRLREAFPNIPALRDSDETLYLGGPVSPGTIFILQRSASPLKGMMKLVKDIYFAPGEQMLTRPSSGPRRVYAGYTAWAPGQLRAEIARGDWRVVRRDPAIVFAQNPATLWAQLSRHREGNWI